MLPLVLALALFGSAGKPTQTALVGATVIADADAPAVRDAVVLIEAERIKAVGPARDVRVPGGAKIVDVAGGWIIPGLIDAHVHFFQSGGLYTRPDVVDLRHIRPYADEIAFVRRSIETTLARYLASGVTAVADLGGPRWNFEVRSRAHSLSLAPRVAVAGPLIATWAPAELTGNDVADPPLVKVESAAEARAQVRAQLGLQPDFVKVWFIHWPGDDLEQQTEIVRAAIETAHAASVRAVVHATELVVARAAVDAGADILAHSIEDRPVDEAFIRTLRERGVTYITTLAVREGYANVLGGRPQLSDIERRLGDPAVIATLDDVNRLGTRGIGQPGEFPQAVMAANLRRLARAGVSVAAGTDAGNIGTLHGPALHRELELMAAAGLEPRAILAAATRGGARVMDRSDELGAVAPGRLADLVVLDGDPLADIRNTQRIRWVVKNGQIFRPGDIVPGRAQLRMPSSG